MAEPQQQYWTQPTSYAYMNPYNQPPPPMNSNSQFTYDVIVTQHKYNQHKYNPHIPPPPPPPPSLPPLPPPPPTNKKPKPVLSSDISLSSTVSSSHSSEESLSLSELSDNHANNESNNESNTEFTLISPSISSIVSPALTPSPIYVLGANEDNEPESDHSCHSCPWEDSDNESEHSKHVSVSMSPTPKPKSKSKEISEYDAYLKKREVLEYEEYIKKHNKPKRKKKRKGKHHSTRMTVPILITESDSNECDPWDVYERYEHELYERQQRAKEKQRLLDEQQRLLEYQMRSPKPKKKNKKMKKMSSKQKLKQKREGNNVSKTGFKIKVNRRYRLEDNRIGICKWRGRTNAFGKVYENWVGIMLEHGNGEHNGTVKGVKYFSCKNGRGIMARPIEIIQDLGLPNNTKVTKKMIRSRAYTVDMGRDLSNRLHKTKSNRSIYY